MDEIRDREEEVLSQDDENVNSKLGEWLKSLGEGNVSQRVNRPQGM